MNLEALEGLGDLASLGSEHGGDERDDGGESNPLVDGQILINEDESDGGDWEGQKEDPDLGIGLSL